MVEFPLHFNEPALVVLASVMTFLQCLSVEIFFSAWKTRRISMGRRKKFESTNELNL